MTDKDDASSAYRSSMSTIVSTALRDLQYFDQYESKISNNKLRKRLDLLWQSNQHIKSVRRLTCEFRPLDVNTEALQQIRFREREFSRSGSVPTPPSSIEYPEQPSVQASLQASVCQKFQDMTMIEELMSEDIETSHSEARLPVLVPFMVQHHVCLAVQSAMEGVCFALAQKHLPELLRERQWDCPEAASLPTWLDTINRSPDDLRLPPYILSDSRAHCALVLHEAVVERRRLSYDTLRQGIHGALGIIQSLPSETLAPARIYAQNLCTVAKQLRDQMRDLEPIAAGYQAELDETLAEIAAKRAELDAQEAEARQHARDAMAEYEAKWDAEYKATFSARDAFC
ncbi:hypothetical protein NHJ13051_001756 [Beauveria bassiana]